jgi:hypothetical protein
VIGVVKWSCLTSCVIYKYIVLPTVVVQLLLSTMSAVGGDTTKGLLLPFFDGEPAKFKGWWMRFKSYATIKNFSQATQRTAEADLPTKEDMNVSQDKPMKAARDRNLMAISCLTMAFQDDALVNIIELSETADWPSGLAYKVIDELFKKYRPVDIISRVEMRTRLSQVHMKAGDDQRVLFIFSCLQSLAMLQWWHMPLNSVVVADSATSVSSFASTLFGFIVRNKSFMQLFRSDKVRFIPLCRCSAVRIDLYLSGAFSSTTVSRINFSRGITLNSGQLNTLGSSPAFMCT